MAEFRDLGLREELLSALEDAELETPTALQEAVIPTLRRGSNVVARASAGAGKTLAYALGILDRLESPTDPEGGETTTAEVPLRLLIVVPTAEEAERIAYALFAYAQAVGLSITVGGGAWGTPATEAEILVTPAAALMTAVRASALKLEAVESVVIDGASTMVELGDWDGVDAVLDLLPRDAQRVVVSSTFSEEVRDLVDRRVKRALTYPAESALEQTPEPTTGEIGYVLVSGRQKVDVLARQLAGPREAGGAPPVIFCRTDERAAELAEELSIRGFVVGEPHDTDADVAIATSETTREELLEEGDLGQTVSYDVPADLPSLRSRHAGDADAVVLVEPRELPHLHEIAKQARLAPRSTPLQLDTGESTARLREFREELRRAIQDEDLAAQLLVLEPLLDEFSAAEVAAAATALLRHRRSTIQAAAPRQEPAAPAARAEAGAAPATWARLYVGVGSRDEVRPGDLVGALAGEANIPGAKIGKIEIRDSFSVVEVEASVADQVIRSVNGTTVKGRSVRVDYDRGGDRARRAGGGPPRRTTRQPPREKP